MLAICGIFLLLFVLTSGAGYLVVRYLGGTFSPEIRWALLPLAGSAALAVWLLWIHTVTPITPIAATVGLVPTVAGCLFFIFDWRGGRFKRFRPAQTAALFGAGAAAFLLLVPLFQFGYPTSFGITSNDSFFYTQADWTVQQYRLGVVHSTSRLALHAETVMRFGINYLSILVQFLTGFSSWQVVQIAGAYGLFLGSLAGYLLARRFGAWWPAAMIAGIAFVINHFFFRLFLDGVLGFSYGLPFLAAFLWTLFLRWPKRTRYSADVLFPALILAGLGVFYYDLLPLAFVLGAAAIFAGFAFRGRSLRFTIRQCFVIPCGLLMALPLLGTAARHFLLLSSAGGPGRHFDFARPWLSLLHFTGMMDVYSYIAGTPPNLWQNCGSIAVLVLVGWFLIRKRLSKTALLFAAAVALPLFVLLVQIGRHPERDYSAHRVATVLFCFLVPVVFSGFRRAAIQHNSGIALMLLIAVAAAGAKQPYDQLLTAVQSSSNHVTSQEKQIGDEWVPALPAGSILLVDSALNTNIFFFHYSYVEALRGMRNDESRIVLPRVEASYMVDLPPLATLDLSRVTHLLRLKGTPSATEGRLPIVAENQRYELDALTPRSFFYYFGEGFHAAEQDANGAFRWAAQDAKTYTCAGGDIDARVEATLRAAPRVSATQLSVLANGEQKSLTVPGDASIPIRLQRGCQTISWHSNAPAIPAGNGDVRPLAIQFRNFRIQRN